MVTRGLFDVGALYAALNARRQLRGILWKDVAREAGVHPSTFTRIGIYGRHPDAENLTRLLLWLGDTDLAPYIWE